MPSWVVPPRQDRSLIRSEPRSIRCTGRPRLIPDVGSTRCETRSSAGTSCGGCGSRCAVTMAPGIDKTTLDQVEQYGVTRLLDRVATGVHVSVDDDGAAGEG